MNRQVAQDAQGPDLPCGVPGAERSVRRRKTSRKASVLFPFVPPSRAGASQRDALYLLGWRNPILYPFPNKNVAPRHAAPHFNSLGRPNGPGRDRRAAASPAPSAASGDVKQVARRVFLCRSFRPPGRGHRSAMPSTVASRSGLSAFFHWRSLWGSLAPLMLRGARGKTCNRGILRRSGQRGRALLSTVGQVGRCSVRAALGLGDVGWQSWRARDCPPYPRKWVRPRF